METWYRVSLSHGHVRKYDKVSRETEATVFVVDDGAREISWGKSTKAYRWYCNPYEAYKAAVKIVEDEIDNAKCIAQVANRYMKDLRDRREQLTSDLMAARMPSD